MTFLVVVTTVIAAQKLLALVWALHPRRQRRESRLAVASFAMLQTNHLKIAAPNRIARRVL
jgi:hypothetical protein